MITPSSTYREEQSYSSSNGNQISSNSQYDGVYIINFTTDELVKYYRERDINVKKRSYDKRKSKCKTYGM